MALNAQEDGVRAGTLDASMGVSRHGAEAIEMQGAG